MDLWLPLGLGPDDYQRDCPLPVFPPSRLAEVNCALVVARKVRLTKNLHHHKLPFENQRFGGLVAQNKAISPASQGMLALREQIVAAWIVAARSTLAKARRLPEPILQNTLPAFIDSLARLLSGPESGQDVSVLAQEHGGERARLSGYDTTTLIDEFQLFRRTLFNELYSSGVVISHKEREIIDGAIDGAIRESVNTFAMIQSALREQFIAAITHDIRTPLANARMAAQLIENHAANDTQKMLAQKIIQNTSRIDDMTRDLLDSIVFNSGEHLPLDITQFDMAELVREFAAPGIEMALEPVSGYWCRESIRRALENLLGNAVKYGDGHPIEITLRVDLSRIQLSVHNQGQPIPADQMEAIFQIYRRAQAGNGHRDGWGVGLPYARRVAESHGGSILVSSNAETGTTFTIDVPIDARPFEGAPTVA